MVRAFLALLPLLIISGCAVPVGKALVTYERNSAAVPAMHVVEHKGLYALFPGDGVLPLDAVYLNSGDKFGFTSREGKVVGVSIRGGESRTVPLDGVLTTEYVWKYQGDKQP
jgi:hypothetical protein